jgi:hypothetical protein
MPSEASSQLSKLTARLVAAAPRLHAHLGSARADGLMLFAASAAVTLQVKKCLPRARGGGPNGYKLRRITLGIFPAPAGVVPSFRWLHPPPPRLM